MNDCTISSSSENVELALEEESMAFTATIFVVRCSYQFFNTAFFDILKYVEVLVI